jgi:DNA-binding CsgD family transcriptional regulator/transcriptional regulator with XRE-family HTH domain
VNDVTEPSFGDLLRQARRAADLTQEALAERAGISVRGISDLERGVIRTPRKDTLELIAGALDLPAEERRQWERRRRSAATAARSPMDGTGAVQVRGIAPLAQAIVGRESERQALRELLSGALAGRGRFVLVGGEAGIGKTTLVQAVMAEATERAALVLTGHCYDLTVTPPYGPWVEIVRATARISGLPEPPAALLDSDALQQMPSQAALFEEMLDFMTAVAARYPLVLILEDLHWADPASLELLRLLGREIAEQRLLIVVTYRDDEVTRRHPLYQTIPLLVREASAERVTLRRLDDLAMHELVASRYRLPKQDQGRLVGYLQDRARGNPFFMGELMRALEEERRLNLDGDEWALTDLDFVPVPPLVRQVIDSRLNRLGDEIRAALELAAIIGQDVPLSLWRTVGEVSDDVLAGVVQRTMEAHLLVESADHASLRFTHALVREALYEGIPLPRRQLLHRRVAEALIERRGVAPDTIAYHFEQAGDERAITWFVRAGIRAERVAWLTAAEHFQAALGLMRKIDADPAERGWLIIRLVRLLRFSDMRTSLALLEEAAEYADDAHDPVLNSYVTFCRGEVRFYTGEMSAGLIDKITAVNALRALSRADRQRLDDLVANGVTVPDTVLVATAAAAHGHVGWIDSSIQLASEVIEEAEDRGISAPAEAYWALGISQSLAGEPESAREAYAQARAIFRASHDYVMAGSTAFVELVQAVLVYETDNLPERARILAEGIDAWTRARGAQGEWSPELIQTPILEIEGEWSAARRLLLDALSKRLIWNRRQLFASVLARIANAQGKSAFAQDLVNQILPRGPSTLPGHTNFRSATSAQRLGALLALSEGDLPAAEAWLQAHDRWLDWNGAVLGQAEGQLAWAIWHRAAGNPDAARASALQALKSATAPRQPLALLQVHRLLGELDTATGKWADAELHLAESLRLAEVCAAPYERALTLLGLAELRTATGKVPEALTLLDDARDTFSRLEAKPALARVDALQAELTETTTSVSEYPAGLTQREVEVLRLVAAGQTNARVAEALFISRRTVDQHLRSIYNKLAVSSRAAATRYAVENRLI